MSSQRIRYVPDAYQTLDLQLRTLSSHLEELAGSLQKVDFSRISMAERLMPAVAITMFFLHKTVLQDSLVARVRRTASIMRELADRVSELASTVMQVSDLFEDGEGELISMMTNLGLTQEELQAKREAALKDIHDRLKDVTPPDELPSVQFVDGKLDREPYKFLHNYLSLLTGNYSEAVYSQIFSYYGSMFMGNNTFLADLLNQALSFALTTGADLQYSFNSFFYGLEFEGYTPLTLETLKDAAHLPDGVNYAIVLAMGYADLIDETYRTASAMPARPSA